MEYLPLDVKLLTIDQSEVSSIDQLLSYRHKLVDLFKLTELLEIVNKKLNLRAGNT